VSLLSNAGNIIGGNGGSAGGYSSGNSGTYGSAGNGISNAGTIGTLTNNGSITGGTGSSGDGYGISNAGTINTLINNGTITGLFGIFNDHVIGTLENLQGAGNSAGPLTLTGNLPQHYNIIINSPTQYGQLSVTNPGPASTIFGISSLSGSHIGAAGTRYQSVLTGVAASLISNVSSTLTYQSGSSTWTYQLVDMGSDTWDLSILSLLSGPSTADTQSALHALAPKLRAYYTQQIMATNFANMNTYDCDLFDARGLCLSVGGQQTYVDNPSSNLTSTVVVAGYKVSPTFRIGGFLNQNLNNNTLSSVHMSNANPLMGLFAVWNQNENRLGYQVKVANAYQDKDVTTMREVIDTSEAGKGSTTLNTQSYVGEVSYAFLANEDKTLVRPYAAVRYTRVKQDGYTEDAGIQNPLTYAALEDRSTATLVGVKLNHKLAEKVNLTGSLGIEQDIYHHVDNLTATGVANLTSENFNDNIKRTRPVASIGAYYSPAKNQRIAGEVYYQQLPFQSTGATTAYINYTLGF